MHRKSELRDSECVLHHGTESVLVRSVLVRIREAHAWLRLSGPLRKVEYLIYRQCRIDLYPGIVVLVFLRHDFAFLQDGWGRPFDLFSKLRGDGHTVDG
jgi:hypothetical protein